MRQGLEHVAAHARTASSHTRRHRTAYHPVEDAKRRRPRRRLPWLQTAEPQPLLRSTAETRGPSDGSAKRPSRKTPPCVQKTVLPRLGKRGGPCCLEAPLSSRRAGRDRLLRASARPQRTRGPGRRVKQQCRGSRDAAGRGADDDDAMLLRVHLLVNCGTFDDDGRLVVLVLGRRSRRDRRCRDAHDTRRRGEAGVTTIERLVSTPHCSLPLRGYCKGQGSGWHVRGGESSVHYSLPATTRVSASQCDNGACSWGSCCDWRRPIRRQGRTPVPCRGCCSQHPRPVRC